MVTISELERFADNSDIRDWVRRPFRKQGAVMATDTYMLISIPYDQVENADNIAENEEAARGGVDNILNVTTLMLKVKVADIAEALSELPQRDEIVEGEMIKCCCGECHGRGYVEWTYEDSQDIEHVMDGDCPVCDGEGFVFNREEIKTGRSIPGKYTAVAIDGRLFGASYLDKAIHLFTTHNIEDVELTVDGDTLKMRTSNGWSCVLASRQSAESIVVLKK